MLYCEARYFSISELSFAWRVIKSVPARALTFLFALGATLPKRAVSRQAAYFYSRDELEQIVISYKDTVYRLALMRMKSRYLADDIFQEVFLRLMRQKRRFESGDMLKAWLIRVTINCCNDYYRSARHRKETVKIDGWDDGTTETGNEDDGESIYSASYDPYGSDNPLTELTYEAVMSLSDRLREVIHMFYYEDMSVREIAAALGARENAVKTRLSRARSILKDKLEGVYHGKE